MPFMSTNGIRTYYEQAGNGDPLILLHNDAMSPGGVAPAASPPPVRSSAHRLRPPRARAE